MTTVGLRENKELAFIGSNLETDGRMGVTFVPSGPRAGAGGGGSAGSGISTRAVLGWSRAAGAAAAVRGSWLRGCLLVPRLRPRPGSQSRPRSSLRGPKATSHLFTLTDGGGGGAVRPDRT